jgi:cytochrome c553
VRTGSGGGVAAVAVAASLALAALLAPAAGAEENERGSDLFELCTQCHGNDGGGGELALAPSIAGLEEWYIDRQLEKFQGGQRGQHFDDIAGMRMRPMARLLKSADDRKAVAKYVASLPPVVQTPTLSGGDATRGQAIYTPCIACHGPDLKGNQVLNSPSLSHQTDWYMLTQLRNFKAGIRGARPDDTTGLAMRAMSMTLVDEQAMRDVIAYIVTLQPKPVASTQQP